MKGIFVTAKNQTAILDLPEPAVGPYEALVQVEACGICNSTDWKIIHGEFVGGTFPILLGHESAGSVIQVGEKVRSLKVGDRMLRSTLRDDHIPYPGGRSCWGGLVERAIVTDVWAQQGVEYNAFPHPQQIVPSTISAVQAAAAITLKETLSCLRSTDVRPGQSLAIVGSGPVAQALVRLAKLSGISPVVVLGRRAEWTGRFAALGADDYIWEQDAPTALLDRAIEAVGARDALARCRQVTQPDGKINIYGVAPASQPYLPEQLSDPRVFQGKVAEAEAHEQLFHWVEQGQINLDEWISHTLPWRDYRRGLEMVQNKTANKVILTW